MKKYTSSQRKITKAAISLISREGICSATVHKIALKLKVTDAALYKHYSSKNAILESLLYYFEEKINKILKQALKEEKDGLSSVKSIYDAIVASVEKDKELILFNKCVDLFKNSRELKGHYNEIADSFKDSIITLLREASLSKIISKRHDPEILFLILHGSICQMIYDWERELYSFDLSARYARLWESFEKVAAN